MTDKPELFRVADSLLGTLYEIADERAKWEPFLGALCSVTRTNNAALISHDLETASTEIVSWNFDEREIARYRDTYAALNPWVPQPGHEAPAGIVLRTEMVLSAERLRQTRFYREWGRGNNVVHGIALNLGIHDARFTYLSLNNGDEAGPVTDNALSIVQALAPHILRVARILSERARLEAFRRALDRTAGEVFFVTDRGRVLDQTDSAKSARNGESPFWIDETGHIRAEASIQERLIAAIGTAEPSHPETVRAGDLYCIVSAFPQVGPVSSDAAVRIVTVPSRDAGLKAAEVFGPGMGLSKAETRLVKALFTSNTLEEAAKTMGVKRNTAKSQLASIGDKTGARKQGQVVQLFASLGAIAKLGLEGERSTFASVGL